MKNNLIIFATYWNEKDWIEASLSQIDALNPKSVFLVDGCYDQKFKNCSTDGTREKIEEYVTTHPEAKMISALRLSRLKSLWYLFGVGITWWNWPLRILMAIYYARTNTYRLNQAATFTKMLRESGIQTGDWFMTYDADQFYTDETIGNIKNAIRPDTEAQLLTADEKTFFNNFSQMTTEYEGRNYNNLPHRYTAKTLIVPTRDIVIEQYPKPKVYGRNPNLIKQNVGSYNHYKFRPFDTARSSAGYQVGDRRKPDVTKHHTQPYTHSHPSVIEKNFSELTTNS